MNGERAGEKRVYWKGLTVCLICGHGGFHTLCKLDADRAEREVEMDDQKSILRGISGIGRKRAHGELKEGEVLSFLFRSSPCKDVDVGQPSYALQLGRVDEPSGLPFVLWPITSHKPVHTRASIPDEFFLFWGSHGSIYCVIRGHTPFCEGGKRGREGGGRGRRRS